MAFRVARGLLSRALSFALVGLPRSPSCAGGCPRRRRSVAPCFQIIFFGALHSLRAVFHLRRLNPSNSIRLERYGSAHRRNLPHSIRLERFTNPFVALAVGGGRSKTNFDVEPPVNFNGTGFVFDINGGVLFNLPGTPISNGPRIGWQGGNISGSVENPPTGFLYDVRRSSTFYQEALLQFSINPGNSTRALAEPGVVAANNRSKQAKDAAGDAKNRISALKSSLEEADRRIGCVREQSMQAACRRRILNLPDAIRLEAILNLPNSIGRNAR